MQCSSFYSNVEEKIGNVFSSYGRLVARHPWKIIIVSVLVNGLLGIGLISLHMEMDFATLYTPINSEATQDSAKVKSWFGDPTASNFAGAQQLPSIGRNAEVIVRAKHGNVLNISVLEELEILFNYISEIAINHDGFSNNFANICAINSLGCVVDGTFFFSNEFKTAVSDKNVTYPYFYHNIFGPVYYEGLVGGLLSNGSHLISAQMLLVIFHIRTDIKKEIVISWQNEFISKMETFQSDILDISYAHSDSLEKEIDKNVAGDITLFVVNLVLMIAYAYIATTTARCDSVGQRAHLGCCGVLAAGMAIAASFGIVSASGVSFANIVGVVPFLMIGIGVDDMFVLLSGLAGAYDKPSVEERIAETLRTSGVAITITSLTDLLAFAAGASSVFLSVRNFCIYTGVAVIFCYVNQVTFFVACLTLHEKRMAANRHCMTCMPVLTKDKAIEAGKDRSYILCCAGSPSKTRSEAESHLDKLPGWLVPKIVLKLPCKIIILFLFAGYLAASIYGVTIMKEGLEQKSLVSDSSYYHKHRRWLDENFPSLTPVSFVISENVPYSDQKTQTKIASLLKHARSNSQVRQNFEINWLSAYQQSPFYNDSSEANFVNNLITQFLTHMSFQNFKNDIVIDSGRNVITASRFYVLSNELKSTPKQAALMMDMREVAKTSSLPSFAFSPAFIFFEQYVAILPQTLQTVGVAVATVFLVTFMFMPHPLLLLYITVTVIMIIVGLFGFLPFLKMTLSSITMIHIIMGVGFSVDFTAHICHGFMISNGHTRDERVEQAIIRSGGPVFHGFSSSFFGIAVLIGASSDIFFSFFKVMVLVIVLGITHALLLLPVVLSFIGPHRAGSKSNAPMETETYKSPTSPSGTTLAIIDEEGLNYETLTDLYAQNWKSLPLSD